MEIAKTFVPVLVLVVLLTICVVEFLFPRTSVLNVSAVETAGQIGVYWDENCSIGVYSIDWGVLLPGEAKRGDVVYVRNEGNISVVLNMATDNWDPTSASENIILSWNREGYVLNTTVPVVQTILTLSVSPDISGVTNFSFDIVFEGRTYFLGDVNRDGVVNMLDIELVCSAYMSTPEDPEWNPNANLNKDNIINMRDVYLVILDFGKTWEP